MWNIQKDILVILYKLLWLLNAFLILWETPKATVKLERERVFYLQRVTIEQNNICSVRVSNELGAGNPRAAKFSVIVVSITTILIGVVCSALVFATKDSFPYLFTNSDAVAKETTRLSILLALTVLLNGLQPVLSGKNSTSNWICLLHIFHTHMEWCDCVRNYGVV